MDKVHPSVLVLFLLSLCLVTQVTQATRAHHSLLLNSTESLGIHLPPLTEVDNHS